MTATVSAQLKRVVHNTAKACKCSERTVPRLQKERRERETPRPPSKKRPGRSPLILDSKQNHIYVKRFSIFMNWGGIQPLPVYKNGFGNCMYAKFSRVGNKKFRKLMRFMGVRYRKRMKSGFYTKELMFKLSGVITV